MQFVSAVSAHMVIVKLCGQTPAQGTAVTVGLVTAPKVWPGTVCVVLASDTSLSGVGGVVIVSATSKIIM